MAPRPFKVVFQVRFPEVDSYGVVWHGHYVAYLEVCRNALCQAGGLSPAEMLTAGYKAPITKVSLELKRPARLEETLEVSCLLAPPRIARLDMDFEIRRLPGRELLGTGHTEQVILSPSGELLLTFPKGLRALVERILAYQEGTLEFPLEEKVPLG
jgi:acyl-CoA thioester hydrolase